MTTRRRSTLVLLATLAVALVVVASRTNRVAAAADGDLVIELPDAVKLAVKTEAGGDKIVEFRRDNDGGNVGYLVVATGKGGEYLMRFDRDGVLTRKWVEPAEGVDDALANLERILKRQDPLLARYGRAGEIGG